MPYVNTLPVILFLAMAGLVVVLEARLLVRYFLRKLRRQSQPPVRRYHIIVHSLTALGLLCMLYAAFIEPYRLEITTVRLETDKLSGTSLRIVHISDLHCDPKPRLEPRLPELVNGLKPDVIVFTGDALNTADAHGLFVETLAAMEAPLGKFAVRGNWDYRFGVNLFEGTGFVELPLNAVRLEKDGEAFMVCGVDYHSGRVSQRAFNQLDEETWNVLLYHTPDLIEFLVGKPIDLVLSGHTHGGQIALPFYGALTTMSRHGKQYEAGLYDVGGIMLYVNRGIGMSGFGPRIRFFVPPEITVFDIAPAAKAETVIESRQN